MKIILIGAGNLATNLGYSLFVAGHKILQVYSRTMESAKMLASQVQAEPTNQIASVRKDADAYIFSVKDSVLADLISQISNLVEDKVFIHTAGSMPMDIFKDKAKHYGVLYPMQSFSKEKRVDFSSIPCFLESNDNESKAMIEELAGSISGRIFNMSTDDRKYLHLSAVFACNFVNHCYALSHEILKKHNIPFDVMLPLIDETAGKVHVMDPVDAQTGPAVRYDENVIHRQAQLLNDNIELRDIYEKMSKSIHHLSKLKEK
ncbi:Rossmann-like and DUF2520 domain-containing protein [Segatella albensis]|jgi:predicted short-subunit dehydrogenase-like oxidoreductase (DUF2520 family)|uniref:Rossmann-like and DUF2520 domain-containing protein n=1 Tax=Segatella albensis TaxID=77768 RepID=UPI000467FBA0|nr:Rossmann-like and DUF2520 domain-containing protein [Segatella albensis]